ncbi:MAG TPA: IS481 family transposase [Polyangiaceae bacterium]|nr:IS481 family transposase [Polyangiaceae bacterium]
MNERVRFVAAMLEGDESFTELCERFGISRKQGYQWKERYEYGGVAALEDRSRAPLNHRQKVESNVVELLLSARRKHPTWGPRELLVLVQRHHPRVELPVASTVGEILKKNGLVGRRKRVRRSEPYGSRLREYEGPNRVWCADFKGHFSVGGSRCNPLTITDGFSRYLLCCKALKSTTTRPVTKVFESIFREFGLPDAIRTDNGPPFSSLAPGGLSRLAIWWIRLGIRPERIMPGRPDQNGRHERMHRTLKAETARPPRSNMPAQQRRFDAFQAEYNNERPHEALGQDTPSSHYQPSLKSFPKVLPEIEYPDHFQVLRNYPNGVISWAGIQWYTSGTLRGELLGLEAIDDDRCRVYFGHILLGVLDARRWRELKNRRSFGLLVRADGEVTRRRGRRSRKPYGR